MSASDVSPFHLRFACFTQLSDTCRRPLLCVWFLCLSVFGCFVFLFPRCSFASGRDV